MQVREELADMVGDRGGSEVVDGQVSVLVPDDGGHSAMYVSTK